MTRSSARSHASLPARGRSLLAILAVLAAGCAGLGTTDAGRGAAGDALEPVPEIAPGILAGYLEPQSLPDSVALLPPPPAEGSAAWALDLEASERALALRGTPRWRLAAADAVLHFPEAAGTWACALGAPISEEHTPHLDRLLRRSLADAGLSTYAAKNHYQRARPFLTNGQPVCTPDDVESLANDFAYPSGHSALGWAWALVLAEVAPERGDAIVARGRAFGESRIVCNVHWRSDVVAGRFMGSATVARLHADPGFQEDVAAAKSELAAVRAAGLAIDRDCAAEADALAAE